MEKQSAICSLGKTDKETLQLSQNVYEPLQQSKCDSEAIYEDVTTSELNGCDSMYELDSLTITHTSESIQQLATSHQSLELNQSATNPDLNGSMYELDSMTCTSTQYLSTSHQTESLQGTNDANCQSASKDGKERGTAENKHKNRQGATKDGKERDNIHTAIKRMKLILLVMVIVNIAILLIIATVAILGNIQSLSSLIRPVSNQKMSVQLSATYSAISELNTSIQNISLHLDTTDDNITSTLNQLSTTQHHISHLTTELDAANSNISYVQSQVVNLHTRITSLQSQVNDLHPCGPEDWNRVAYLNMNDPTQQCPSAWREYNTSGVRACGRPNTTSGGSCSAAATYSIDFQYSRVCGRVVGYQYASPDGFYNSSDINQQYVDGVIITHGSPREHVWTYAAGVSESNSEGDYIENNCPCSSSPGSEAPSFIGNNYYCESGNPDDEWNNQLYTGDKLWDGCQCEGSCCAGTDTPLWFKVQLSTTTSDDIHISICGNEEISNEDTPVELIEIYVAQ